MTMNNQQFPFQPVTDEPRRVDISTNTQPQLKTAYSSSHYDFDYVLTEKDIQEGKIRIDAYFVAKQWKTGSRDDSGALFHCLKTIARFGDKNPIEREIKALYNQAKALGRIYNIDLD